jgi:hypothetical protein
MGGREGGREGGRREGAPVDVGCLIVAAYGPA